MSKTVVTYPIVAALVAAERIAGPDREWKPANPKQRRFLTEFFEICRRERVSEIQSLASWRAEEINKFLRERGFLIQLQPFAQNTFGVASILDLLVEWLQKGEVTKIETKTQKTFPGVRIKEENVSFFKAIGHNEPIARLLTKSGDEVFMTMVGKIPAEDFDLVAKVEELSNNIRPNSEFGGLVFPMVDLDQKVDISWLRDLQTICSDGTPGIITQALQQTKLKMNEVGARVQSAVAVAMLKGISMHKPDHIINRPFLMWIERNGLEQPLFVGYITEEDWKNPGSLT